MDADEPEIAEVIRRIILTTADILRRVDERRKFEMGLRSAAEYREEIAEAVQEDLPRPPPSEPPKKYRNRTRHIRRQFVESTLTQSVVPGKTPQRRH